MPLVWPMLHDLRLAFRTLGKEPGFAALAILTLALGIGATTAIYSVVHGVLLRTLPYGEPQSLVSLWTDASKQGLPRAFVSASNFLDWRAQSRSFEDMALVRHIANFNLTGDDAEPERLQGARIGPNLLGVLRARPLLGRAFSEDETRIGHDSVAILSHGLWKRRFASDPSLVGRQILLDGRPHTVVGVMGPDFLYPSREFQIWKPLVYNPEELRTRLGYNFLCVGRLKPGVTLQEAQAEMDAIARRIALRYPDVSQDFGVRLVPFLQDLVGPVRVALGTLLGAVACLLLIGCANLSNLVLARAAGRAKELAVRAALGAGRARLIRQLLAESACFSFLGGLAGLAFAYWMLDALLPLLPASMPRVEEIRISGPVLGFAFLAMALTALLVGALPAWQAGRTDVAEVLHDQARGSTGSRRSAATRDVLVVAQVAAALVLLVGAGLLAKSFARLRAIPPGFETERILTMHLAIPRSKYPSDREVARFCQQVMERVSNLPGVAAVGMVNRLPLAGGASTGPIEFEGQDPARGRLVSVDLRTATPEYFRAMGIPLLKGRSFTEADVEGTSLVGLIDEQVAARAWPGQDPIGRRFRIGVTVDGKPLPWVEVVGVVGHLRHDRLESDERPQVYWNYLQRAMDRMALVLRAQLPPKSLVAATVTEIRAVDPQQPVYDVRTMEDVLERSIGQRRLNALLLGVFAAAALGLAAVGVFGVVAYSVGRRAKELGVRLALGAAPGRLFLMVLRQGTALAAAGVALGALVALVLARVLTSLVFEVQVTDPLTYAGAALAMLAAAAGAAAIPAARAARIDPAVSLRAE